VLKVRVIPTLLWKGQGLVKGVGFDSWRRVGPVLPAIKIYNARDVDELILVDIIASQEQHPPDDESIADYSDACSVPLTVGGGITSVDQIVSLLHAGADKIAINTSAYSQPQLVTAAAARFGVQCVVASIDARRNDDGTYHCFSHAGTVATGRDPVAWAHEVTALGAGEILLTSIDHDGTMTGYDTELIARVAEAVEVPVIASGGAGTYDHMVAAIRAGASAVAAASMFHFTEQTPAGAKTALAAAGVPVRRNHPGVYRA
jgi:imidazole glycerol-phosphate synthase subunit HisF